MTNPADTHPKWTRDEFLAFLLLYAANVDAEYADEEREFIQKTIDPAHLAAVEKEFNAMSDYEMLKVIQSYEGDFYPSAEHKDQILGQVRALFNADGTVSIEESSLMMMLKKIL